MKISIHYLYFFVIVLICLVFIYLSLPEKNKNDNPTPTEEEVTLEETTTEVVVDETTESNSIYYHDKYFIILLYIFCITIALYCIEIILSEFKIASRDTDVLMATFFLLCNVTIMIMSIISLSMDSLKINQIIISSIILFICLCRSPFHLHVRIGAHFKNKLPFVLIWSEIHILYKKPRFSYHSSIYIYNIFPVWLIVLNAVLKFYHILYLDDLVK